jgi:hypothetical protein
LVENRIILQPRVHDPNNNKQVKLQTSQSLRTIPFIFIGQHFPVRFSDWTIKKLRKNVAGKIYTFHIRLVDEKNSPKGFAQKKEISTRWF